MYNNDRVFVISSASVALILALAAFLPVSLGQITETCHQQNVSLAECPYIDTINGTVERIADFNDCLFYCQGYADLEPGNPACGWWTFFAGTDECVLFGNSSSCQFTEFGNCGANPCYSGESTCQPLYECREPGQCTGGAIVGTFRGNETDPLSEDECIQNCKEHYDLNAPLEDGGSCTGDCSAAACNWWTYDSLSQQCLLFDVCPQYDFQNCQTCTSGMMECELSDAEATFHKLMVVNGLRSDSERAETFDLITRRDCAMPAAFPTDVLGSAGAYVGDKIIVCGGLGQSDYRPTGDCYEFVDNQPGSGGSGGSSPATSTTTTVGPDGRGGWTRMTSTSLLTRRGDVAAVKLDSNRLWVTGGIGDAGSLMTTEIYDAGTGRFSTGVTLPRATSEHCIVRMGPDSDLFFMAGGTPYDSSVYIYNATSGQWTADGEEADMPETVKGPFCGYVVNSLGQEKIVVAGGWSGSPNRVTFVYDVATKTWSSTGTPDYPIQQAFNGMSVPYAGGFLTLGGTEQNAQTGVFDGRIFWFNPTTFDFQEFSAGLSTAVEHSYGTAFLIEDSAYYGC